MELVNPVANVLQGMVLRTFADWRVTGRGNVPPYGPLIIVANHQSYFDSPLLSTSIPRRTRFLAKDALFKGPVVSWLLRSYGAYPLSRNSADIGAYRWALRQLERDRAIALFPEGTRTLGGMRKAHPGVALLALRSQAPILPVGITGTERLGSIFRVFKPTGTVGVNMGAPFSLPNVDGNPGREVLDSLTEMIMQRIAALLPKAYHGVYAITPRAAAADTAPEPALPVD
jgi:1-acyl-sn-glycerol-3-phosphate acyltransferase